MIGIESAANPFPPRYPFRSLKLKMSEISPFGGPSAVHVIAAASSHRLSQHIASSFKKLMHVGHVPRLKDVWLEDPISLKGIDFIQLLKETVSSTCSSFLSFSAGGDGPRNKSASLSASPATNSPNRRQWTNVILALNILVYVGQVATKGKLLYWGAKINSLIDKGQIWRLVTSSFLHANVMHLMVNCYSLNSVGPTVEAISGPRRFLTVYLTSAVASAAISYWCNKAPAIGASGAIFGLVGSVAMFTLRHRGLIGGGKEDITHIAKVIVLNMAIGLLSSDIDNWGHFGGLLGGVAISWLVGPAWKYEATSFDGRRIFSDKAPIFNIIRRTNSSKGQ